MMESVGIWILFWMVLLIFAVSVFAGLALVVTIGGLFDIRCMFRAIEAEQRALGEPGAEEEA